MNSDIMVYSNSVKTDMEKRGVITEMAFRVNNLDYIVKRINGVYHVSSEKRMYDVVIDENFYRDVDLAMKAYSKVQNSTEDELEA